MTSIQDVTPERMEIIVKAAVSELQDVDKIMKSLFSEGNVHSRDFAQNDFEIFLVDLIKLNLLRAMVSRVGENSLSIPTENMLELNATILALSDQVVEQMMGDADFLAKEFAEMKSPSNEVH